MKQEARNGRIYGDYKLLGDNGENFFKKPVVERALDLAYSEGCPEGPRHVLPVAQGGRGAEVMEKRYGEVIFWFGYFMDNLRLHGHEDLVEDLSLPHPRRREESLGAHSPNWLPADANSQVYRSAAGYILPRLFTEFMNVAGPDKAKNMSEGLNLFDRVSRLDPSQNQLVVYFAEDMATFLQEHELSNQIPALLKRLLTTGKIKEDRLHHDMNEIFLILVSEAPILFEAYKNLPFEEKVRLYQP